MLGRKKRGADRIMVLNQNEQSISAAFAVLLLLLSAPAHAQNYEPLILRCSAMINAQHNCASCAGLWPQWAACAAQQIYGDRLTQQVFDQCVERVTKAYTGYSLAHGNRAADVLRCLAGQY
jgi:hypothetical protein